MTGRDGTEPKGSGRVGTGQGRDGTGQDGTGTGQGAELSSTQLDHTKENVTQRTNLTFNTKHYGAATVGFRQDNLRKDLLERHRPSPRKEAEMLSRCGRRERSSEELQTWGWGRGEGGSEERLIKIPKRSQEDASRQLVRKGD
ncbi:unnamed protein product [Danaus chrysippus]|uniref:(African queen) hypothetical protein n=1 Tax=Danaus chrysippus TaxID=151541 RepID=A0A8J2QM71_9NEOP|nr:unnamed protein product [Danaus chrysippus]